jgi:hypothetical protein
MYGRLKLHAVAALIWSVTGTSMAESPATIHLDVYKSPTCGCCTLWMDHLAGNGFTSTSHHPDDLGAFKRDRGVPMRYGSCHTGVSAEGYVFEGHVPARYVRQFLADPPDGALGLSVPAMPVGSPGMEYRDQFMPYDVLLLRKDGAVEVFASVASYDQQFEAGD